MRNAGIPGETARRSCGASPELAKHRRRGVTAEMQSISRLLRQLKMRQPRMGSTEWGSQEVGSPQRRGTAGRHALSRSLQDPEAAPAGKSAGRKREPAAHNLVRPGTCSCPEAREERAKKEKRTTVFLPTPAPRGTSAPAGAPAQTGVRGMAQGNLPAVSQGTFFPVSVSSPMMYVGKGGNCMAEPGP